MDDITLMVTTKEPVDWASNGAAINTATPSRFGFLLSTRSFIQYKVLDGHAPVLPRTTWAIAYPPGEHSGTMGNSPAPCALPPPISLTNMTGAELREARRRLSLTQLSLAELLDVTRVTVNLYEKGRSRVPRVVQLAVEAIETRSTKAAERGNR